MTNTITKRNGDNVPFDPKRIRKAIYGAFWEEYNDIAVKENKPKKPKGEPLDKIREEGIDNTLNATLSLIEEKETNNVEEIQDLVEMSLYRAGFPKIAHRYVVYRMERKKKREISETASKLTITKSSGEVVPYNPKPIEDAAKSACNNIENVSWQYLYSEIENSLYDGISTSEITESMLASARTLIEKEPNYNYVAARLLLQKLGEEAFGELDYSFTASEIPVNYQGYFQTYIKKAIELELLRPELAEFDLDKIAKAIVPERDLLFQYLGLKTLYDRYFIKTKFEKKIELPQAFWMRVAMGLARLHPEKEDAAIRYYNILSELRGVSSTPTLFNAGTKHEQCSSCFVAGSPIDSSKGSKAIEKVLPGELVLTESGKFHIVKATREQIRKGGCRIHVTGILSKHPLLDCTKDHLAKTIKKEKISCKRSSGIIPCPQWKGTKKQCLPVKKQYKSKCDWLENLFENTDEWLEAQHIEKGDYVKISFPREERKTTYLLENYCPYPDYEIKKGRLSVKTAEWESRKSKTNASIKKPKNEIPFNENFGRWLGYYFAKGNCQGKDSVIFTFKTHETEFIQDCISLSEDIFGLEVHSNNNKDGSTSVVIHSRLITEFILQEFGTGFNKKKLNQDALEAPIAICKEIIKGIYRGNACTSSDEIILNLANETLSQQIFLLGLKIGKLPVLFEAHMDKLTKTKSYNVKFHVTDSLDLIQEIDKNTENLTKLQGSGEIYSERLWINGEAFYKVEKVETHEKEQTVYDLQVEEDHTFTIRGAVVHNCYLLTVDDTIEGIFKNYSDNARLSKWAGGIGNDWTAVRGRGGYIKGTNGVSQGGVPWWKITNDTAVAVNQGSKRKGAICNYLETWHIDLLDFLDLRKNTGDERSRTHDMNTANWIPDLFMKRLEEENSTWWMISPDSAPDLHDRYGKDFEQRYKEIEEEIMAGPTTTVTDGNLGLTVRTLPENKYHPARRVETQALWRKMLTSLFETGHPWIVFKDPGNIRNPQNHVGVIHSSNLCTEIFLNTSASTINNDTNAIEKCGETAVCNLASINLAKHIVNGQLNEPMLRETTTVLVEMLDNVIDINYYPIPEAKVSNMQHRPIGLGVMGFHTAIQKMRIPYSSQDAIEFSDVAQEIIALAAIEASSDLAVSRGKYPSFEGSKWSLGILPLDSVKLIQKERGEEFTEIDYSCTFPEKWEKLREKIKNQGMRNSNVMAIAPTACVTQDTLILSENGLLPIKAHSTQSNEKWEDIQIKVAQEKGTELATKFYHNGIKPITKLQTHTGTILKCTSNERVRTINSKGNYTWKWVEDIQKGDTIIRRLGGHKELLEKKELIKLKQPTKKHHNEKPVKLPMYLNEDWAEIIGYFMANGFKKTRHGQNKGIVLIHNTEKPEIGEFIRKIANKHQIPISPESREGCEYLLLSSSRLADLFDLNEIYKEKGNHGEGAASAYIPNCILASKTSVAQAFLKGLFEENGTVENNTNGTPIVEIKTVSEKLADQTKQLLEAMGIRCTKEKSGPGTWGEINTHRTKLTNISQCEKFQKEIGFRSKRKKEILKKGILLSKENDKNQGENVHAMGLIVDVIQTAKKGGITQKQAETLWCAKTNKKLNTHTFLKLCEKYPALKESKLWKILQKGNLIFEQIENIESLPPEETYDLSVPNTETYVANGIICHNTIANISGVSEGITPEGGVLYTKENLSGTFTVCNPILVKELQKKGLWNDIIISKIKMKEGSIQSIEEIPQEIRDIFQHAYEIPAKFIIEAASRRQKWIDQGQSCNLFVFQPTGKELSEMYKLAWRTGLKSTYYLRSKSASVREKTTVEVQSTGIGTRLRKTPTEAEKAACSLEARARGEECEACQ